MKYEKLEDTLGGEFNGLLGEVETQDCYRLRQVKFQPDIIFDIGGNVGVFARHARKIFPESTIVSVEPDPDNCEVFRQFTPDQNTFLLEMALGIGQIYHGLTARNGSGHTYLSTGLGYPSVLMAEAAGEGNSGLVRSHVSSVTVSELVGHYLMPGRKSLLKMDCEGAENSVWTHPPSMDALRRMDYLAMEIHFYALTGAQSKEVREVTMKALASLEKTHDCELDGVHFWATKKNL